MTTSITTEAIKVIEMEAFGLLELSKNIPNNFEEAIDLITKTHGRVVIVGIGKSGHIGRKISSTMASLGQMSFFMHPSEALHGDFGMISTDDILLLISYSGESSELFPITKYAKENSIKTISITGRKFSTLARETDVPLIIPHLEEACPFGIAPTVSSTMTLALGDAIAISLIQTKKFSKEKFKTFHPGGNIGSLLSTAKDIMHTENEIPLVQTNASMKDAILEMSRGGFGCVGVADKENHLIGVITDGDLRRNMDNSLLSKTVNEVMSKSPKSLEENYTLQEILTTMENNKITNSFIVDKENKISGIIHIHDILARIPKNSEK